MSVNYNYDKKRFEAFIDAIIAILLTILVLEIRVPDDEEHQSLSTYKQVVSLLPVFVSYIASFLLIVGFWIDYHILFVNISHISKRFILLNMLFVLSVSFAPFTTAFAGTHYNDSFAVSLLMTNYFFTNLFFSLLYAYAMKKNLVDPQFWIDNKSTGIYSVIGIIMILVSIPLAFFHTYTSFTLAILVFFGHLMKKK